MIFASFAQRSKELERIDDLDMTGEELEHNLRDLSLIFIFLERTKYFGRGKKASQRAFPK